MATVFQRVQTPGIAQISYLIGDDGSATAAVIDPRPDVDVYLRTARQHGVAITHVFETHIHADFMSGSRELIQRLGRGSLCVSGEGGAEYDFKVTKVHDRDTFEFGSTVLTVRHTPGHTPEHVSYEIAEKDTPRRPWAVFTGDSLFVGSAGRPDLLGQDQTDELMEQLFHTLRDYYLKLDDEVIIYPCHGAGSACGADIGDRPMSTIGFERKSNAFLQHEQFEKFKQFVEANAPPEPHHYRHLKKVNASGPPIVGHAAVPALIPHEFREAIEHGDAQLLDVRDMLAFGGGHIAGAMNIGPRPELSVWAGQMLDYKRPILLVVEDETNLDWIIRQLTYVGFIHFGGYLAGGMSAWRNESLPLQELPQISVHELKDRLNSTQVVDVRSPQEWNRGHIPGARHLFVAEMRDVRKGVAELNRHQPVATYCASGYRASIAASLLKRRGFTDVLNVPGSWQAWTKAGYEVER